MPTLPAELMPLIVEYAPLFSKSVWAHAKVLVCGAILALGKRTLTSCLRIMGKDCAQYADSFWAVLAHHIAGRPIDQRSNEPGAQCHLVRERAANFLGRDRDRKTLFVGRLPFFNVGLKQRCF